ncbi:YdcF family protein, partial [Candidatus Saccharibacteria bacterium]|nr:YdcF family protein [Candidatus Saccharibacteria bacterium]
FARTQKHDYKLAPVTIFSGGQGKNEPISEAKSMQNYSFSKRYKEKTILEDKSKTTRQNFLFSKQFIKDDSKVAFATTDFHVFRSGVIASKSGYRNIESISAKSPWYFYNNALIREFVANIYSERKMHLFNILLINTVSMSLIILSYVFHIM